MRIKFVLYAFALAAMLAAGAAAQSIAVTNARIVTVSGPTIEKGTVVVRDGLIESVGANIAVPADAVIIEGSGLTVYPGLIDAASAVGIQAPARPTGGSGSGPSAQSTPAASNSNFPAGLRPEETAWEALKAGDAQFESARNAGFTTAVTVGRTGIFNGQSAVINLAGDSVSGMLVHSPAALHISYSTVSGTYPGSLLGTFSALRQMFHDARRHQALVKEYNANPLGMKRPEADRSLDALIPVLERRVPVVFNANTEMEIIRSLDLAKEFNLNAIIAGATEAYRVVDRLKAANVPVLLSLNLPKRTTSASPEAEPETLDVLRVRAEAPKNAAKLSAAGVKFAFQTGGMTNLADFSANAEKAVAAGLNSEAAIRAMTIVPAEIFGVADRLGSIEKGKIANLTVVRGDVLKKDRVVKHVIVDGKVFEIKAPPAPKAGTTSGTAAAASPVAGSYNVTIDVPGQPLSGTLSLIQGGSQLTGSLTTSLGVTEVQNGKVTGNGFSFTGSVVFQGANIDIIVNGTVSGNQVSGTIDSPHGPVPFLGTRIP